MSVLSMHNTTLPTCCHTIQLMCVVLMCQDVLQKTGKDRLEQDFLQVAMQGKKWEL